MEAGFKRLWRRKKTKDPGATSRTTSSAGFGRNDSFITDGRRSSVASRPFDKLNGNDYISITSGELPKTKSGNRIQPILIGISRPGNHTQRPETATSLNTAVQRAADTARVSQDGYKTRNESAQGHRRSISGRSVDLLKVAGKLTGYKSRFNEEIAARNLDTNKLSQEITRESGREQYSGLAYVPTSRYQEEVADRNASGMYGSKTSFEYERATSLTNSTRNVTSPVTSPKYQSPRTQTSRPSYEQPAYHSRQYGLKSRDGSQPLPSIMQERTSEEDQRRDESRWANQPVTSLARVYSPTTINQVDSLASEPLPELPRPELASSFPAETVLQASRQISSSHSQSHTTPILSPPVRHPGRVIISRDGNAEERAQSSGSANHSVRTPSVLSSPSRNAVGVGERRIMDLTQEDFYSETSSTFGYSQHSPVLEQASTGRFEQPVRPKSSSAYGKHIPSDIERIPEVPQESTQHSTTSLSQKREQQTEPKKPSAISFSAINTIASLAPQKAIATNKEPSVTDPVQFTAPREEHPVVGETINTTSQDQQQRVNARAAPLREDSMSRVQRAAAALEARSASQSPKPTRPTNGETVKRRSYVASNEEPVTVVEKAIYVLEPASTINSNTSSKSIPPNVVTKSSAATTEKAAPTQEAIHTQQLPKQPVTKQAQIVEKAETLPETPQVVDLTSPSDAFAIRTRDFAVHPVKPIKSQRKKSDPQLLKRTATENAYKAITEARNAGAKSEQKRPIKSEAKKSTKSQTKRSASAAYIPPKSEFDEEAFARKQAEAKAALLRLQQSLQEDFTLPVLTPPHRKPQYVGDEGSPVAPTSIVYPKSSLSQVIEKPSLVRSQTDDTPRPLPPSFRSTVTAPDRATSASSMYNRAGAGSSRRAAPASLQNIESSTTPIDPATLPPSLQQLLFSSSAQQPRSPGEISLSSFPIPTSRPGSEHDNVGGTFRPPGYSYLRRNSNRSLTSVASQFSIPFQMIPDRSSSYRDAVIEEDDY